jgi:hypothetical protein
VRQRESLFEAEGPGAVPLPHSGSAVIHHPAGADPRLDSGQVMQATAPTGCQEPQRQADPVATDR